MSTRRRPIPAVTRRSVFAAATLLQATVTLLAAGSGIAINSTFCDGSPLCGSRGARWLVWFALYCLTAVSGVLLIAVAGSGDSALPFAA